MRALPWTKFQDFYLRLGFLKVLVAALSAQRRSAANDEIYRRLQVPLFLPAKNHPKLVAQAIQALPPSVDRKDLDEMSVAEALLIAGDCPSWLYAVTQDTVYKILDWGHDIRFVGAGNQITERGLLLRQLLPADAVEAFWAGDPTGWNPFVVTGSERLLLLYQLCDIDHVTSELIFRLSDFEPGSVLESADAAVLTCRSLFAVLERAKPHVPPHDLPAFRTARELACTIARELAVSDLVKTCGAVTSRVPSPRSARAGIASRARKTTKNADHQTIPRFEQLVDLGFLSKPAAPPDTPLSYKTIPQRRWRYQTLERSRLWRKSVGGVSDDSRWLWKNFAAAAVRCGVGATQIKLEAPDAEKTIRFLTDAYARIRRPVGHTPFESVALLAMILAASEGYILEMTRLHELVLSLKKRGLLSELVFFASGNELDKMFVLFKSGFERRLLELYDQLDAPATR